MAERKIKVGSFFEVGATSNNVRLINPPQFQVELFIKDVSMGLMTLGNDAPNTIEFTAWTDIKFKVTPVNGKLLKRVTFRNTNSTAFSSTNFNPYTADTFVQTVSSIDSTLTAGYFACLEVEVVNEDGSPLTNAPVNPTSKSFLVGNYRNGAGVVSQVGAVGYTANITVIRDYNPDNPSLELETVYPLTVGVRSQLDISGYSSVSLKCVPLEGHVFSTVNFGSNGANELPFTPDLFEYEFSTAVLSRTDNFFTDFEIRTIQSVTRKFIFGNDKDGTGKPVLIGANSFTGTISLYGAYDPDNMPEQVYNIVSGAELNIPLGTTWSSGTIELNVVDGFKFTSVEFPNDAAYTNNTVTYELSDDELKANITAPRLYVAYTQSTVDPDPVDPDPVDPDPVDPDPVDPDPEDPDPNDNPDTVTNNYLLTKERFKTFQTELFNTLTVESVNNYQTLVTDYLSAAKLYPFNINPINIWGQGYIKIRDYSFSTLGKLLKNDYIVINFGEIETPKINDNATDIVGVTCDLVLPFRQGVISLDPYKVMGKKVTIEGRLYITKGEITINIYDSNGINFNISNFNIGSDYLLNSSGYSEDNMFSPNQALTLVNKAYILIKTPIYDETPKVLREGILSPETGRIEVTEVNLKGNMLGDEKTLIEDLLKNGVYIND